MPLRDAVCPQGHRTELLVRSNATPTCHCGESATLTEVNRIAVGYRNKWASEFQWSPDMVDAHEEAKGYKREYVQARAEAEQNGFRL